MRPELIILRGLPASGKTTWANDWVLEDPLTRVRVNRDDLRKTLHGKAPWSRDRERLTIVSRDAIIRDSLKRGISVVSDDTNLPQRVARDIARIGRICGANVQTIQITTDVDECVRRDASRPEPVGEKLIREMNAKFLSGRSTLPFPTDPDDGEFEPYEQPEGKPLALLVDIDGTVALKGPRGPFDWDRVGEDAPNQPVIDVVNTIQAGFRYKSGIKVIFMSGRSDACRAQTDQWIRNHITADFDALHMRADGDMRKDSIVKAELFDKHVRRNYRVFCVLDDRNQVVDMWRKLGLTCLQVAPGDF